MISSVSVVGDLEPPRVWIGILHLQEPIAALSASVGSLMILINMALKQGYSSPEASEAIVKARTMSASSQKPMVRLMTDCNIR